MKKLIYLILFFFNFILIYVFNFIFLNLIVSAPPRYHEIVYTFDDNKFRNKREKLIF